MSRYDKLEPPKKGEFFRFPDGESQVRLVSEPYEIVRHFIQAEQRSYACPGSDKGCKHCAAGDEAGTKFIYRIIDRADGHLKLAEVGWSIVGAVKELHDSKEYGFDELPPYDIFVTKAGKGLQTKYTLLPARADLPLTDIEKEQIEACPSIEDFIEKQMETAQYVDPTAPPDQRAREQAELDRMKRPAVKPTTPLDTFNRIKGEIAAAKTEKEVSDILGMAIFEKDINDTMDRMLKAAGDTRKQEIAAGLVF